MREILRRQLAQWRSGNKLTASDVMSIAEQAILEEQESILSSGRPDWKAEILALASARDVIQSVEESNQGVEHYVERIICALESGTANMSDYEDPDGFAAATLKSIAVRLKDLLDRNNRW